MRTTNRPGRSRGYCKSRLEGKRAFMVGGGLVGGIWGGGTPSVEQKGTLVLAIKGPEAQAQVLYLSLGFCE